MLKYSDLWLWIGSMMYLVVILLKVETIAKHSNFYRGLNFKPILIEVFIFLMVLLTCCTQLIKSVYLCMST